MQRLEAQTTAVVLVDIQERLASAMPEAQLSQVVRSARILSEAALALGAPMFVTEQYPKGLGPTLPAVAAGIGSAQRFEKLTFSAWEADGFAAAMRESGARAAVVIGMESHVCVFQTVRDLVVNGLEVYVPIDGVSSRRDDHQRAGVSLCERAGAIQSTTESVVFDWLQRAGGDHFKALSKLIR